MPPSTAHNCCCGATAAERELSITSMASAVAWRVYSGISDICSAAAAAAAGRDGLSPSFQVWRRLRTRKNSVNEKNSAHESTTSTYN